MYCTNCSEAISEKAEVCPKCGVPVFKVKKYCHDCASPIQENQEMCVQCGASLKKYGNSNQQGGSTYSPALMGVASFFIPGLGQIIMGQVKKGITLLVADIVLAIISFGLLSLVIMVISVIDAVKIAVKKQNGQQVEEWEFF